ncbi:MAG: hypothetical protein IJI14_16020 [Anaerolineaceae bacterium]|nr:hypothetical protein [Anaerolineaceae bacterium]
MRKKKILLFLLIFVLANIYPVFSQAENTDGIVRPAAEQIDQTEVSEVNEDVENAAGEEINEENVITFSDSIRIDGRTYKVAPGFTVPSSIDIDSPVKINFDENTHEVVSIERLVDDTSNNDFPEYHFGTVNTISKANLDLQYRVYIDGVGYLFDNTTKIDEKIAFLDKYATAAVITYKGKVVMCKVFSSNVSIPEEDMFLGPVESSKQDAEGFTLKINGVNHRLAPNSETVGAVTVKDTWVFGYEVGGVIKFVSVITDSFPDPLDVQVFKGFVSFTGNMKNNGIYYITVEDESFRVTPDSAVNDQMMPGDYVCGYQLNGDVLTMNRIDIPYDKSRYEIFYQPITDVVTVRDYSVPGYKRMVSFYIGGYEISLEAENNIIGEPAENAPVMAVFLDGNPQIIVVTESFEQDRVPVYGYITSVSGTNPNFEFVINGKKYTTNYSTYIAAYGMMVPGTQVAGIANRVGQLDLIACFDTVLPNLDQYMYAGEISKIALNAFQIDDRIIDYDTNTVIKGTFSENKYAAVSSIADYAELVYILPDELSDYDYGMYSGVLNGLRQSAHNGTRAIRLDEEVFYIDENSNINRNPVYDEIGTALYKGINRISIMDVSVRPNDQGNYFKGKITASKFDESIGIAVFKIDADTYYVRSTSGFIDMDGVNRLYPGAFVEGFAYGDDVLAIRLLRGAGLVGILNPPWMEYVIAGLLAGLLFILLIAKLFQNKSEWKTGYVDIGAAETIIIREENGKINNYAADPEIYKYLTEFTDKLVSVKIRKGKIIEFK